eukprot:scaffold84474_cov48-Prasinocladus_malaysianus.AAC.1
MPQPLQYIQRSSYKARIEITSQVIWDIRCHSMRAFLLESWGHLPSCQAALIEASCCMQQPNPASEYLPGFSLEN